MIVGNNLKIYSIFHKATIYPSFLLPGLVKGAGGQGTRFALSPRHLASYGSSLHLPASISKMVYPYRFILCLGYDISHFSLQLKNRSDGRIISLIHNIPAFFRDQIFSVPQRRSVTGLVNVRLFVKIHTPPLLRAD